MPAVKGKMCFSVAGWWIIKLRLACKRLSWALTCSQ